MKTQHLQSGADFIYIELILYTLFSHVLSFLHVGLLLHSLYRLPVFLSKFVLYGKQFI